MTPQELIIFLTLPLGLAISSSADVLGADALALTTAGAASRTLLPLPQPPNSPPLVVPDGALAGVVVGVVVVVFCPQNVNAAAVLPTLLAVLLAVAVVKALGLLNMAKRAWKSSARLGDSSGAFWAALAVVLAKLLLAVVAARYALAADTAEKPVTSDAADTEELVVVVVVVAAFGTPGTGDVALGT